MNRFIKYEVWVEHHKALGFLLMNYMKETAVSTLAAQEGPCPQCIHSVYSTSCDNIMK